ncbi:hypothetical protein SAMN05421690_11041 [Nitrosomonas sp. Nm51]|uniref:hypothetical protein n=1 Tax=Nitrosomonas sp. Nm51 TaxID=133720 RepID=UPI0008B605CD|nr:hypothetical protein [Nitrosomonas sp. Nm51]SER84662.1 hypothetical protein SAMN05421690_11041 [Nitrosomonas sp. Nm51]
MNTAKRLRFFACLLAFVATNSFGKCYDVDGVIKAVPVPYSGNVDDLGCAFPYPRELNPNVCFTNQFGAYLAISGSGNVSFTGTSELTTAPVVSEASPDNTLAFTPLIFPPLDPLNQLPPDDTRVDLQIFTSQAILVSRLRGLRGTLYTKDSGVITQLGAPTGGFSGQIVKIVGGDGDFDGATGLIGVAGQEVGGEPGSIATYTGRFCVPD